MKKIIVLNRQKAVSLSYKLKAHEGEIDGRYAIISISEVCDKKPYFERSSKLKDVLYLRFDDVEETTDKWIAMSDNDARKIADFVKYIDDKIDVLIVHCLAGRSRSAGVAAAISKWKLNDDKAFFKEYTPNMLCYRKVLSALMVENS